jgi:nucleoside phosphorylase
MSAPVLVCFAVPQEARPFRKFAGDRPDVRVLVVGMGARNAERSLRIALESSRPSRVFSCGFAGALSPDLQIGDVITTTEFAFAGIKSVRFVCAERVAVTVAEKSALRARTGADAVEMESAVLARVCRENGIECITLRSISDAADQDLPLDFNALMNEREELSYLRLTSAILHRPLALPKLMRLGRNSAFAAAQLATALARII